jgi:hypothetical protein
MPYRVCPVCRHEGQRLEDASTDAYVSYYRCNQCGTVWVYNPQNSYEPIRIVMSRPLPKD